MNVVEELKKIGSKHNFRVVDRQTVDYDKAREISNSRINRSPSVVVFPKNADQVGLCVEACNRHEARFRVRSGGHHHEGMCSLDGGVVIRLSEINKIQHVRQGDEGFIDDGVDRAWIGVGKPLQEVYDELEKGPEEQDPSSMPPPLPLIPPPPTNKTIPGGGCQTVNIGGLTLGGGWGTSVRKMGLTCDNFDQAELVTAEGKVIRVKKPKKGELSTEEEKKKENLFWALRGGGGGNFGIVTRFLFRLSDIGETVSTVSIQWGERSEAEMAAVVQAYLEKQPEFPVELSTTMVLRVDHRFRKVYNPIGMGGKYYGPLEELQQKVKLFSEDLNPSSVEFKETHFSPKKTDTLRLASTSEAVPQGSPAASSATVPGEPPPQLSGLINDLVDFMHFGDSLGAVGGPKSASKDLAHQNPPPSITCSDPWPHKISSGFVKTDMSPEAMAKAAVGILLHSNPGKEARAASLYMVLHGMPGQKSAVGRRDSAFYWRKNDFLVQFQAWWSKPNLDQDFHKRAEAFEKEQRQYIEWIAKARTTLKPYMEGAFVNFVDKNIPVEEYYGGNFERLKAIKRQWDPNHVFRFPLGIPVE